MLHDVALYDVIGGHKAYIHRQSVRGGISCQDKDGQWACRLNCIQPQGLNINDFFSQPE